MSFKEKYDKLSKRVTNMRKAAEEQLVHVRTDVENWIAAGGVGGFVGYREGKGETAKVFVDKAGKGGVDVGLLVGAPAKLLAYSGVGGKGSEDLHAIGTGALSAFSAFTMRDVMLKRGQAAGTAPATHGVRQLSPGVMRIRAERERRMAEARG